jgi:hypothetical protein
MTDEPIKVDLDKVVEPIKVDADEAADSTAVVPTGGDDAADSNNTAIIAKLMERLHFFFSNANLCQDRWMRNQMTTTNRGICNGPLSLKVLMRFNTLKSITKDKLLLAAMVKSYNLMGLISYNKEKEEVERVMPFDFKTMGDGSKLSLYAKNVSVRDSPPKDEEGAEPKKKKFRPHYAFTRNEVKALFDGYH